MARRPINPRDPDETKALVIYYLLWAGHVERAAELANDMTPAGRAKARAVADRLKTFCAEIEYPGRID